MRLSRDRRNTKSYLKRELPGECFVAEVVPGLTTFAEEELQQSRLSGLMVTARNDDELCFSAASRAGLMSLTTVQAIYSSEVYAIPRPKALLGDQHFRRLQQQIQNVLKGYPAGTFKTLHVAAAGSDSSVMTRLKESLCAQLRLDVDNDAGDVLLRIRLASRSDGWESLVRLTPRPSATRDWRACDMPGALNGSVAQVMSRLAAPQTGLICNLTSGSGTIAIEHTVRQPSNRAVCVEIDENAIVCAGLNAATAQVNWQMSTVHADAQQTPFPGSVFDALAADLPFGQLIGSHQVNMTLYPRILREAARIAIPGARFVVLTHEVRLMDSILQDNYDWAAQATHRITLRGLHPRIYVLRRN